MSEVRTLLAARSASGDWTDNEMVLLAANKTLQVHKFRKSEGATRRQAYRLVRARRLRLICEDRGTLYFTSRGC